MKNEATIIGGIGSCTPLLSSPRPRSYSVGRVVIAIASASPTRCVKRERGRDCRKARRAAAAMIRFE